MNLRKLLLSFGVSKRMMSIVMQLKTSSRRKKNQETNYFVIGLDSLNTFLQKLKPNLSELPDKTRFQLAIKCAKPKHWFMVDCYVKDGILHTFTLDAANVKVALKTTLENLLGQFPIGEGKHYVYWDKENKNCIQKTSRHCQTFTREHIALISKMNSDELYDTLKNIEDTSNTFQFGFEDLNENHQILAPIFRSAQSYECIKAFNEKLLNSPVSGKNKTLNQWIDSNLEAASNSRVNEKQINFSINKKQTKYLEELLAYNGEPPSRGLGFGFITLPILAHAKPLIQQLDNRNLKSFIQEFNNHLDRMPKHTKLFSSLKIRSSHSKKTKEIQEKMRTLIREIDQYNTRIKALEFIDIVYQYAGYLDKAKSVRSLDILKQFFDSEKCQSMLSVSSILDKQQLNKKSSSR